MSSGRIAQLDAVNRMLRGIGAPTVSALDTGASSLAGDAEALLNEIVNEVQAEGWFTGVQEEYEYKIPTAIIAISGGAGDFIFDELVTESTSLATGTYKFSGSSMYLVPVSGTFTGGETLTGGTSGATRTGATATTQTSSVLYVSTNWVRVVPSAREYRRISKRGDQLYDETNQTASFSANVFLNAHQDLFLSDLPYNLGSYVAARAAWKFQRWRKRGRVDDSMLKEEMMIARLAAVREDDELRGTNTLNTSEARQVKGDRSTYRELIW